MKEWKNVRMKECKNVRMKEWKNERMIVIEWMNEWMNERTNEWMSELMNERVNEWRKEGRKCMDESLNQWNLPIIFQKCSERFSSFNDWCDQLLTWWWCGRHMKSSSRYSLVHLFPTSSAKSAPNVAVFTLFMWNRALATVSCTFCHLHSCALFVDRFPRSSRATAETETLLRRPRKPLYLNFRFSHPGVFSSLNSRVAAFPAWWWRAWHDEVVDIMIEMMMWLPWWWERWPWQSSVSLKFPN